MPGPPLKIGSSSQIDLIKTFEGPMEIYPSYIFSGVEGMYLEQF